MGCGKLFVVYLREFMLSSIMTARKGEAISGRTGLLGRPNPIFLIPGSHESILITMASYTAMRSSGRKVQIPSASQYFVTLPKCVFIRKNVTSTL